LEHWDICCSIWTHYTPGLSRIIIAPSTLLDPLQPSISTAYLNYVLAMNLSDA